MSNFKKALSDNRKAVVQLSDPELKQILPTLMDIREKTARSLAKFLKGEEVASEYSLHKHRSLIVQLDNAIGQAQRELPSATFKELKVGSLKTSRRGVENMQTLINEGERKFRGSTHSLRLPMVKVLTDVQRTMMGRFEHKSQKYAGDVGRRIRNDLVIGVIRGESVGEMTKRVLGKDYAKLARKGATAVADGMADKTFFKSRSDAERLVRTEMVNVYTETQLESLHEANEEDPGYQKMWDAANDKRVCELCWKLDEVVVNLNESFPGGIQGPPLHPNDRCCVCPWRRAWGSPKGSLK